MADQSDSTLDILIKLGVIGKEDAKAARDLLTETGQAAKDAGKGADFLNPAMVNSGKAMEGASEHSKNLLNNHRLLHAALHQTGVEIPGLTSLLQGLFNPATIGLVAGMTAIHLYFEHLEKVQAKQLEWTLELQKTNDALHEITASGKTAGEQLLDINKALADGQVKAHGYTHDIEMMTRAWKQHDAAVKDAAQTETQANSDAAASMAARIEVLEKAGVISKQTAEDMKALAIYEAEVSKVQAERTAKEEEYSNLGKKRGEAQRRRGQLGSDSDAQKKLAADQSALDRNEADITKLPAIIKELKQQAAAELQKGHVNEWDRLTERMQRFEALLEKARNENPDLEKKVAQDKDTIAAIGSLDKTVDDLTGEMNLLNQSIVDFNKSSQAHLDQAAQQRNMKEFGGGATDMLKLAEDIAKRYQNVLAGKAAPDSVSQTELTELVRISEAATGRTQNARTAMGTMIAAAKNIHVFGQDVEHMVGMMEQISYSLPNNLKNRLQAIEAAISRGDRPHQ